ncbi:hypothetical protein K227x_18530 [Rubripirellula lacrimiformis]|uniref:Uncharacterized protein n=1 Tax=Rubripirellula lacrimiformis TaxID=1930273 RepID=A0A517N8J6_9BACT|nr:hypothetical protein K227x_18530 [Rubripirellula lacrimiformis]
MPAAQSFNRVGNAPRAPDQTRGPTSTPRNEREPYAAQAPVMPAAQSFNRVGNAPRASDRKRAARWARG